MDAMHEGEVAALLVDLNVDVETRDMETVVVSGEALEEARERLTRAALVSAWRVSQVGSIVVVHHVE